MQPTQNKKSIFKGWKFWTVIIGVVIIVIAAQGGGDSTSEQSQTVAFGSLARERFDSFLQDIPELESIGCEDDCNSVAYFNFKELPDDLEFIIRGHTATYSKFKKDNSGVSHVSIIATHNGRAVFQCNGSEGKVDECHP